MFKSNIMVTPGIPIMAAMETDKTLTGSVTAVNTPVTLTATKEKTPVIIPKNVFFIGCLLLAIICIITKQTKTASAISHTFPCVILLTAPPWF